MKYGNPRKIAGRAEKGAALVVGLLLITILTIVGISAARENAGQQRMANNYRFSIEAMNNAEVGFISAVNEFNAEELAANGFDDELDPNGDGRIDDSFRLNVGNVDTNVFYNVVVVDDDDGDGDPSVDSNGIVRLMSQGISNVGSTRTVDVRIGAAVGVGGGISLEKAILAEETIEFSGNSVFSGSNQDVHSNGDVLQMDHPWNEGHTTAVGSVQGEPQGGGTTEDGADYVEVPQVDPTEYEEYADYVFHSDGKIYDGDGNFVADADGDEWNGWKFGGDKWTTEKDEGVQGGFLYFKGNEGNVVVGSAVNKDGPRWLITILADGYIEISGNPHLGNYMDPDHPMEIQALMLMSGSDIKINGNPDQSYNGIIAAREQFEISGNPIIEGTIISQGASDDGDMVKENKISGVMQLTYDGSFSFPSDEGGGGTTVVVLSWLDREIARNTGVFEMEGN